MGLWIGSPLSMGCRCASGVLFYLVVGVLTGPHPMLGVHVCFQGRHEVTQAAWRANRLAIPYDILMDSTAMDFNGDAGYCYALHVGLKTLQNVMLAPVCSSWVNINQGTAGRSKAFPLGDRRHEYVKGANKMVTRTILLIHLFAALGVCFVLEQPCGSLMQWHPRFQDLLRSHVWNESYLTISSVSACASASSPPPHHSSLARMNVVPCDANDCQLYIAIFVCSVLLSLRLSLRHLV
jgi:hypothetical protein